MSTCLCHSVRAHRLQWTVGARGGLSWTVKLLGTRLCVLWVVPCQHLEILVKYVTSGGLRCRRMDGWADGQMTY